MLRFLFKAVVTITAILGGAMVGVSQGWFPRPSFFYEIGFFLTISTVAIYSWTSKRAKSRPLDFVNIYLSSMVVRMLLYGIFISVIIVLDKEGAEENSLLFLACYFAFTALEVIVLFRDVNSSDSVRGVDQKHF